MKVDEMKLWYEYNFWAMRRILVTCARVSAEQYAATTSLGSLRATLVHVLDAQWSWRQGFLQNFVRRDALAQMTEPARTLDTTEITGADVPTLPALIERWAADEREMRAYLDGLRDEDLDGIVRYMIPGGIVRERVLWHCLLHVVNHGTQHRSEAALMLTSMGHSPGELDVTAFLNEYFHLPVG